MKNTPKILLFLTLCVLIGSPVSAQEDAPAQADRADRPSREEARKNGERRRAMMMDGFRQRRAQMGEGMQEEFVLKALMRNEKLAEALGVTEEQMDSLKTHVDVHRVEYRSLEEQLKDCGMQQAQIMTQDQIDEEALMLAIDECFEIRKELAKLKMQQLLLVKRTLTPDQIAKARQMMREHMQKRMKQMREGFSRDRRPDAATERPRKRLEGEQQQPKQREQF